MGMQIKVGSIYSQFDGFDSIAEIAKNTQTLFWDTVELDLSSCNFFEANMTAALYVVVARLRDNLNDVSLTNIPNRISTILRKNRFMDVFNQPGLPDTNQTTLPFKIFKLTAEDQFNEYLDTYMEGRGIPTMSVALAKRYKQSLLEIFLNAGIHSESDLGVFVCGQFYPQKQRMDFTIVDAGVGIPE